MKYKQALKESMEMLSKDDKTVFVGYGIKYGNQAFGTLIDVDKDKIIETPLAENLMAGLSVGLSIDGYKPVLFFERFDFIFNALDSIVNHLNKFRTLSRHQYRPKVIIRVVVGRKLNPFFTGITHTNDYTEVLRKLVDFPVLKPMTPDEVLSVYKFANQYDDSVMIVEETDLYELDF